MSQVAHLAGAYPGCCSMKQLGVFLLPPGWDARPEAELPPALSSLACVASVSVWVQEQRKTKEWDFVHAKLGQEPKYERRGSRGGEEGRKLPLPLPPLFSQ